MLFADCGFLVYGWCFARWVCVVRFCVWYIGARAFSGFVMLFSLGLVPFGVLVFGYFVGCFIVVGCVLVGGLVYGLLLLAGWLDCVCGLWLRGLVWLVCSLLA